MLPDISSNSDRRRQYDSQSKIDKISLQNRWIPSLKSALLRKKGNKYDFMY